MGPVALVVALGLILTACGRLTDGDRPVRPGDGRATSNPRGGSSPVEPTPERVTPRPGSQDARPTAWERIEVGDDDRTLQVFFWGGVEPCYVLDRVEVAEDSDSVTVTLYQGHEPVDQGVACIEIAILKVTQVVLDAPLAGRTLMDGAEDKA